MPRSALYAGTAAVAAVVSIVAATTRPDSSGGTAALDGASLFRVKGCATCHYGPDSTALGSVGPRLDNAAEWSGDRVDGMSAEEYVAQSMRNPSAFISPAHRPSGGPGGSMPLLQLSDDEIDALVAYLLGDGDSAGVE
jgi:mono/diheme cytochrome c family protein